MKTDAERYGPRTAALLARVHELEAEVVALRGQLTGAQATAEQYLASEKIERTRAERAESDRERLEGELAEARRTWTGPGYWQTDTGINHRDAINRAARAEAERDRALEALRSVVDEADDRSTWSDYDVAPRPALDRARAVLADTSGEENTSGA